MLLEWRSFNLGHIRSVDEGVNAVIQEDVQGIAISYYQGGHAEYPIEGNRSSPQ